jgi:demethylmenaquinone methyltransferase/2-methoxy-6-polyprenyl-1,4-benzoquinol methylase
MERNIVTASETVKPYNSARSKADEVEEMFDNISPKYDFLNSFLSAGIDKSWRRKLAEMVMLTHPKSILDVATGTAEMAIQLANDTDAKITGVDISAGMLGIGQKKINKLRLQKKIALQQADSLKLPFADQTFDAITVAFGVRNFESLEFGIREMLRVLRPGRTLFILEFSDTEGTWVSPLFKFYFKRILPFLGKLVSGDSRAYTYLPQSVEAFPAGKEFCQLLLSCGASTVTMRKLTAGIATIYCAKK